MIDSYSFGKMTINGKTFCRDLIILPDGMIHFYLWQQLWRKLKGAFRVQPVFLDRAALQLPVKPMKSTVSG